MENTVEIMLYGECCTYNAIQKHCTGNVVQKIMYIWKMLYQEIRTRAHAITTVVGGLDEEGSCSAIIGFQKTCYHQSTAFERARDTCASAPPDGRISLSVIAGESVFIYLIYLYIYIYHEIINK